jgi:hypothetical protein
MERDTTFYHLLAHFLFRFSFLLPLRIDITHLDDRRSQPPGPRSSETTQPNRPRPTSKVELTFPPSLVLLDLDSPLSTSVSSPHTHYDPHRRPASTLRHTRHRQIRPKILQSASSIPPSPSSSSILSRPAMTQASPPAEATSSSSFRIVGFAAGICSGKSPVKGTAREM